MKRLLLFTFFLLSTSLVAQNPWINELHYDNDDTDVGEFVEIAGNAGINLADYRLIFYNGSNGTIYRTTELSGVIPDEQNGVGALAFTYPSNGIQNGSPDGIALVDIEDIVSEFISYEGTMTATEGPALGLTSVDIGVQEGSATEIGKSLGLVDLPPALLADCDIGGERNQYEWAGDLNASPGTVNQNQTFCLGPALPLEITSMTLTPAGRDMIVSWSTASEDGALSSFEVEHSQNGVDFEVAGSVEATNQITGSDYEFVISNLMVRTHYFRISQLNHDGTVDRTEVLRHDFEIVGAPEVYPTVSSDFVQIDFVSEYDGIDKHVRVFNLLGQEVYSRTTSEAVMSLDVSGYSEGRYFVQVLAGQDVFTRGIVKR